MLPLMGSEEHISASIAAVIQLKTQVIRRDVHVASGPPASRPRKNTDL